MKVLYTLLSFFALSKSIIAQRPITSPFETTTHQNGFLKNVGQVRDLDNKSVDFIYYHANLGGQQVVITNYGLSIFLSRPKKVIREGSFKAGDISKAEFSSADSLTIVTWEMERIDIVLKDASIQVKNITSISNPKSPQFNFYLKELQTDHHLSLQKEVLIKNVYPGIDWRVYINEEKNKEANVKYDFIIHPGADISQIKLHYSDNAKIELVGQEIKAATKMGVIYEKKPFSYLQENNEVVKVEYSIRRNTINFKTTAYDESKTLIIDPSIFWMTYLSSTSLTWTPQSIYGNDIETDNAGNIFVQLSASQHVPFPGVNPGGGAYYQDYTSAPDGAMVIVKFAPGGQMLWSTYFGNGVEGKLMTVDKFGNIIAIGAQRNGTPSYPITNPTIPLRNNGGYNDVVRKKYFITKFSNSGSLLWSSYYAGFSTSPMDMSYDINGNVYVVGWSEQPDFPVVDPGGGAYMVNTPKYGYAQVLFISQFDVTNHLTWSTRIEGMDYDPYARVCTDKVGNIYLGGQVRSTNYPLVNAGGYFNTTPYASVLTRFNPARHMNWSTYFTASFSFADLTTDDSCNLYVVADTRIIKFDSSTNWVYSKTIPTTRQYFWNKINYDPHYDNIQVLGVMNDVEYDFPALNTPCNGSFFNNGNTPNFYNSATDPIFATINHNGQFTYLSLADWIYEYYSENEMTVDIDGNPIYLFGHQQDGYVQPNPQLTNPGNGAYFDSNCCYNSNGNSSALLLKLTTAELTVIIKATSSPGCNCNASATATPQCGTAPYSYLWSNAATAVSVNNLCPGNYWVKVTDANGRTRSENINIPSSPGSITSVMPSVIPENCTLSNGGITILSVQGGTSPYSYSLDGITYSSSAQFNRLTSGNYIVRVKDANGCIFNDTTIVSRLPAPSDATLSTQKSSCFANDGALHISNVTGGVGPYRYALMGVGTNNTGDFTNLAAANYQLTITDTAGCTLTKTVLIEKAVAPTDADYSIGNDHCNQGIGFIGINNVTGGTSPYLYSVDSIAFINGQINKLAAGKYNLYVKDSNGCIFKKGPVNVGSDTGPGALDFIVKEAVCGMLTGEVQVNSVQGGSPPFRYSIDSGSYVSTGIFKNVPPGLHDLHVRDLYNCIYSRSFQVAYKPLARITLKPIDTTVCYNELVSLKLAGDMNQVKNISWSIPSQGTSATIKATDEQKVYVTITDSDNCIIRDTSTIRVRPCNSPENCLAIPNAFTPNKDGKNELLIPLTNGCRLQSIDFRIYDRWGAVVYETNKQGTGWDGIYKGISEPIGVYIYICNYVTDDGVKRVKKGTLTLIR